MIHTHNRCKTSWSVLMNDCKYCGGQCPEHVDKNGNPNHHTCFDYLSSMVHNTSTCSIVAVNSTMLRNETKKGI